MAHETVVVALYSDECGMLDPAEGYVLAGYCLRCAWLGRYSYSADLAMDHFTESKLIPRECK